MVLIFKYYLFNVGKSHVLCFKEVWSEMLALPIIYNIGYIRQNYIYILTIIKVGHFYKVRYL